METYISYRTLDAETEGTRYSLTLKNESAQPWTFYVYQKLPGQSNDLFSLAWFASPFVITPGNRIKFAWDVIYNFVWSSTGTIEPGVTFEAHGEINCSPDGANTTTFSMKPGPNLSAAVKAPPSGSLVIKDVDDIPNHQFSVGIGMSGTGTFAEQAGPNLKHQFTPTPSYWVAAGTDMRVGTVLSIQTITNTAEVKFPVRVFDRTLTLNESNLWV